LEPLVDFGVAISETKHARVVVPFGGHVHRQAVIIDGVRIFIRPDEELGGRRQNHAGLLNRRRKLVRVESKQATLALPVIIAHDDLQVIDFVRVIVFQEVDRRIEVAWHGNRESKTATRTHLLVIRRP
jgi:hypothetical protein